MVSAPQKTFQILLVEDNPADAMLAMEAIRDIDIPVVITHVEDGRKALEALEEWHKNGKLPDLMLLDLAMPHMDGKATLKAVRARAEFASLPVLILTTSSSTRDIEDCQREHANAYLVKPLSFGKFSEMLVDTLHFWLRWPLRDPRKVSGGGVG